MPTKTDDARLRELQFLADVDRQFWRKVPAGTLDQKDRAMVAQLIQAGCLSSSDTPQISWNHSHDHMVENLKRQFEYDRWKAAVDLAAGQEVQLNITHLGRVRLSELRQAMQTGRDREPFGILLGQRNIERDVAIALASCSAESPLSVAYLDANGFKAINDELSHADGDEALRTFMSVVAGIADGRAEAYRAGGDELVIVMPSTKADEAVVTARAIAAKLHNEKLPGGKKLSVSCGIVTTVDAKADTAAFISAADAEQKRAKQHSRKATPRPSVIAVPKKELEVIPL